MKFGGRWLLPTTVAIVAIAMTVTVILLPLILQRETVPAPKPEAPPDLAKLRGAFQYGLDALRRGAGSDAVRYFSSFHFGGRAVEQYRLFFLANAWQVAGNPVAARATLVRFWDTGPRMVYWEDAGLKLGELYASIGDWHNAALVYGGIAARSDHSPVTAAARWNRLLAEFIGGDIASVYQNARDLTIKNPRAEPAADGIAVLRSLSSLGPADALRLTPGERLERAVSLLRDGDPRDAFAELTALAQSAPADLRLPIQLNRGLALHQLRRYQDSNALLEPLASGPYRFAIPAIYHGWKNYSALAASINPTVTRTVAVRKRVGTVRVKVKGRKNPVARPKYATVHKTEHLVDLAKKHQKESYENLAQERLKDLLTLPLADEVRIEVLNALIGITESKNDDDSEQKLITELAKLDPSQEAGLQRFWDKAWAAYTRGDLNGAAELFLFIRNTYRNPNVRRQSEYWYARSIERLGRREEAQAHYRTLASAPYDDIYALFSESHGAPHPDPDANPLTAPRPDWPEIAEREMPAELRLAYELTALDDARDARLEIQRNVRRSNAMFADALLADLYHSSGDTELMMRSLRRAFPQMATVEQDSVPAYFLSMYYPIRFRDAILKNARKNKVDPYLVMALIHQESYFNPRARSPVGAAGLMQLMPPTAKELASILHSSSDVENPEVAIRLGTFYFRQLIDRFGGAVQLAVASYNAGMGNVMRWRRNAPHKPMDEFLESMPFAETKNYVKRVTIIRSSYRRMVR